MSAGLTAVATSAERTDMAMADPEAWVRNVERLYQAHDAAGVAALSLFHPAISRA
jgi:hypothetical protein